MTLIFLKSIFEEQTGRLENDVFLNQLATFNSRLLSAAMLPQASET